MKKWNKVIWIILGLSILVCVCVFVVATRKSARNEIEAELTNLFSGIEPSEEELEEVDAGEEIYATSHTDFLFAEEPELEEVEAQTEAGALTAEPQPESTEALTDAVVMIRDVYVEKGTEVTMKSFYPGATDYLWEQYDLTTKSWNVIESVMGMDELHRTVSMITVFGEEAISPIMLRCRVSTPDEQYEDIASIHVLNKEIEKITVSACEADAGEYLSAKDVPVEITYTDGSKEQLTGLYGLYWLEEEANTEYSFSASENMVETVTTVLTDMEYRYIELGKEKAAMRYRIGDKKQDIAVEIEGKDLTGPDILEVELGDYQTINEDKAVPIQVTITAIDNYTNYTKLKYCFLPEGKEPEEADWTESSSWEASIDKNGNWIAYVKDENGNISTSEREIIAVDQKAPDIKVSLENTDWCEGTKIMVEGTDNSAILYAYACPAIGVDSGWTELTEYAVNSNGIWTVSAKDTLGNTVTKEITISNIDKQMPVIHAISITTTPNAGGETE